jgi:hypothetical protein
MAIRRMLVAALLLVVLVPPVEAAKRRSAGARGGGNPRPGGDCHVFGLVRAGTKASYLTTTSQGNVTFTITWISDAPTRTHTRQQVQTPQGNADVETVIDGEVVGTLRGMKKSVVTGSTVVPGFGTVSTTVTLEFVPSLIMGPAEGWCVGAKWDVAPVTETITTATPLGAQTQIVTTVASQGEVLAVGEVVNVTGGQYRTVKYRGVTLANNTVQPVITWVSMDHNIVVKQDTLDASGTVTSVTQLTSLQ